MFKYAVALLAVLTIVGCSHSSSGVVGSWRSSKLLIVFKADRTWTIVGLQNDSGTWDQDGTTVKINPIKIQGKTRQEYTARTKGDMSRELENLQAVEKAYSSFSLELDDTGTKMKDKSGRIGDLTRQPN